MKNSIAALLVVVVALLVAPISADAITVNIANNASFTGAVTLNSTGDSTFVNIAGTYFGHSIANVVTGTRNARVAAVDVGTADKLTLTDAVIRNVSNTTTDLYIRFTETFDPVSPATILWWGASMSGSFVRGTLLASADSLAMATSGGFREFFGDGVFQTSRVIGNPSYTVPNTGSITLNNFAPQNPAQTALSFSCNTLTSNECSLNPSNFIFTTLIVNLRVGDTLRLPGSVSTFRAETEEGLLAALETVLVEPDVAVPEPSVLLLMGAGLAGLVLRRRR